MFVVLLFLERDGEGQRAREREESQTERGA